MLHDVHRVSPHAAALSDSWLQHPGVEHPRDSIKPFISARHGARGRAPCCGAQDQGQASSSLPALFTNNKTPSARIRENPATRHLPPGPTTQRRAAGPPGTHEGSDARARWAVFDAMLEMENLRRARARRTTFTHPAGTQLLRFAGAGVALIHCEGPPHNHRACNPSHHHRRAPGPMHSGRMHILCGHSPPLEQLARRRPRRSLRLVSVEILLRACACWLAHSDDACLRRMQEAKTGSAELVVDDIVGAIEGSERGLKVRVHAGSHRAGGRPGWEGIEGMVRHPLASAGQGTRGGTSAGGCEGIA